MVFCSVQEDVGTKEYLPRSEVVFKIVGFIVINKNEESQSKKVSLLLINGNYRFEHSNSSVKLII